MAQDRRYGRVLLVVLIAATLVGTAVFVSTLFAQGPEVAPPMDPGMDPGMEDPGMMGDGMMMDGMGGMGGAPAGTTLTWTNSNPVDEDRQMSYGAFLAESGQPRSLIPDVYLYDAEDVEEAYSYNQWAQLHRIYSGRVAGPGADEGRPGGHLAARVNKEIAVKGNELAAVQRVYARGLNSFAFKVGFPQMESGQITPTSNAVSIDVGVIMSVRPNMAKCYPNAVYRALKKFDNYGVDRQIFRIVDYEGGVWNPKKVWLWNGAVAEWNRLWSANDIVLTLYDVEGDRIVSGRQSAMHDGGICAKLVHPDELNYAPMFETIMPAKDCTFEGAPLNLDYSRGWYYNFSFSIPLSQLAGLDRAEVQLIGADGAEGSRGETQAPSINSSYAAPAARAVESDTSSDAAQDGGDRALDVARTGLPMTGQSVPGGFY